MSYFFPLISPYRVSLSADNAYEDYLSNLLPPTKQNIFIETYKNPNGVEVEITSDNIESVHAVLNVLIKHPPTLKTNSGTHLNIQPVTSSAPSTIQPVKLSTRMGNITLDIDNKIYSGSGAVIIVIDSNNEPYVVLFKHKKSELYQELGGKLEKKIIEKYISKPYEGLYHNARGRVNYESLRVFELVNPSIDEVEIKSPNNHTLYKVYLYIIRVKNIQEIKTALYTNRPTLQSDPNNFSLYDDFSDIDFFKLSYIQHLLIKNNINTMPYINMQTVDNINVKCKSRTFNVLRHILPIYNKYSHNSYPLINFTLKNIFMTYEI